MQKFFNNISIKSKIMLVGFFIILLTIIPLTVLIYSCTMNLVQQTALNQAKLSHRVLNLLLNDKFASLKEIAQNKDFTDTNADILIVVDKTGKIIADKNNHQRIGHKLVSFNDAISNSVKSGNIITAFDILSKEDAIEESKALYEKIKIKRKNTDGSKQGFTNKTVEEDGLVTLVVNPIKSSGHKVTSVVIAADILNKDFAIVDKTKDNEDGIAVTIFKDDLRIATTVLKEGKRAIGTLLSAKVVDKVLIDKQNFTGRAIVVGQPYWSFYSPILNVNNKPIGVLFAAISENKLSSIFIKSFGVPFLITVIILLIILTYISVTFAYYINKPIKKLTDISLKLADNDFSVIIPNSEHLDEIGHLTRSFKKFVDNLKNLIKEINNSSNTVSSESIVMTTAAKQTADGSQRVALGAGQLAEGTQQISQNIEEGAININQINDKIQNITLKAKNIAESENQTEKQANQGKEQVKQAINKIDSIRSISVEISVTILELGKLSKEIEQILDLIKNISGQTNLLALNAAIEAARAGENGKGFAVVADEVKKLANQSGDATDRIAKMIKEIQGKTQLAVATVDKASHEVEDGVAVITDAGTVLENIINQVSATNNNIQEITKEIEYLAANSDDMVKMIENISAVTEETAASAEEIASITEQQTATLEEINASSHSLSDIAKNLQKQIAIFKL
ncbi:MAG: methyl-accepting chemotaxis protein [Candidatus Gastranaerophilaceae bacterium]